LVYCPHGHRIEVQERHRGQTGRCPKCQAPFFVPEKPAEPQPEDQPAGEQPGETQPASAAARRKWMTDVHLHTVNPEKLRLKAGSLQKDFQEVDLGFSKDGLLVVTLFKPGGLAFGSPAKKKSAAREKMLAHLEESGPIDDLPVAEKTLFETETLSQLSIAQPIRYDFESMFAGVPVFGDGRIAVRLPRLKKDDHPQFVSFHLSGFREFSSLLREFFQIEDFGADHDVPLTDSYAEHQCHYSEQKFEALVLDGIEYLVADPAIELETVGRKCQECGLIVSEDARKKEKIGGKNGKAIAKALCPKCKKKFGEITLYDRKDRGTETAETPEQPGEPAEAPAS
ncbi:MAG: hypothetical protein ACREIV_08650, partial [Planctomycetaceae bacterium]